jgi:cellulose synthase operon protein C
MRRPQWRIDVRASLLDSRWTLCVATAWLSVTGVSLAVVGDPSRISDAAGRATGVAGSAELTSLQPEDEGIALDDGAPKEVGPMAAPKMAAAVRRLMDADYLSEDERRSLRIRHGVWDAADLASPRDVARAALLDGRYDEPALRSDEADPLDRAESLLRSGKPRDAISRLENATGASSARALRLLGRAQMDVGELDAAATTLEVLASRVFEDSDATADDLAEGVRGLVLLARLRGAEGEGAIGYQAMIDALARGREQLDRLSWNVLLAEAELFYEKDKFSEAGEALQSALALNPRLAEAWFLAGRMSVDGFDFPRAEAIAKRLDELANSAQQPSIHAAIVRAAVLMRENEGAQAEAALAPALARFPEQRELLAQHAAAAASRYDFEEARSRLAAFDALAPGSPEAYLVAGRVMAGARQYEEAADFLRVAKERAPKWAEPVVELGLSELQAGRLDESRAALESATALDRYNVRAANSLTLIREIEGYATLETPHFLIRYKPGEDEVLAREMPDVLEKLHARVAGDGPGGIDFQPPSKTVVELYPNHRWFGVRITGLPRLHTIAAATGPVIAMEAPRDGPGHKAGPFDWARVVQHEYTHTVTLARTKNRLPHWFTEASAVYLEDAPRDESTVNLLARAYATDTLFDLDTINVAFVRPAKPTDRGLAYAQGHWMYEFIIERFGKKAPLDLMDRYATGEREASAMQAVLGVTREEFVVQFKEWAQTQLEGWGMAATDEHPDVPALMKAAIDAAPEAEREAMRSLNAPPEALVAQWLEAHSKNPFVLELALRQRIEATNGKLLAADAPLAERYAAARPMAAYPHRLLAAMYLAAESSSDAEAAAAPGNDPAIAHLEFLDAREQHSNSFAIELARRYAAAGEMDKALAKAVRATQIAPYDARTRELAATIGLRARAYDMAERQIKALIVLEPDRPIHAQRLEALKKLGRE